MGFTILISIPSFLIECQHLKSFTGISQFFLFCAPDIRTKCTLSFLFLLSYFELFHPYYILYTCTYMTLQTTWKRWDEEKIQIPNGKRLILLKSEGKPYKTQTVSYTRSAKHIKQKIVGQETGDSSQNVRNVSISSQQDYKIGMKSKSKTLQVNMLTETIQEAVVPRTNENQVSPEASQFLYEVHSNFVINCGTLYLFIQDIFFRRMLHIKELVKFWFRLTMKECVTSSSIFQPKIKGYWLQVFHTREKCLAIVWVVIKFQL